MTYSFTIDEIIIAAWKHFVSEGRVPASDIKSAVHIDFVGGKICIARIEMTPVEREEQVT